MTPHGTRRFSLLRPAVLAVAVTLIALATLGCESSRPPAEVASEEQAIRRVVALLDYVAADYGGAVSGGVITNETEYREQLAFLQEAKERLNGLATDPADTKAGVVEEATRLVSSRAEDDEVGEATRRARSLLIAAYGVELGPASPPSAERGQALYAQSCVLCHGATGGGDGPAAAPLQPPPRSFRDPDVAATLSPVRAFSALTDGVAGTAMVSFSTLSEADRWSLAFYVTGLRHDPRSIERGRTIVGAAPALAALDFTSLGDLRDIDLTAKLRHAGVPEDSLDEGLAFLRRQAPYQARGSIDGVRRSLTAAKAAYGRGDATQSRHLLTDAYLDGFEPIEARLLVSAPELVRRIEDQFLALREGAEQAMPVARFESDVDALLVQLEAVEARLRGETSPWSAALAAFVVVLREGVESVLLVLLLLGLAKRAGAQGDQRAVHAGWGAAIAAGIVTWFASAAVVALGGGNRELVEGIVALLAVVVLLYAGHFVLARMDAQRRIAALKRQFAGISTRRRNLLLFSFSFIAAYREAFEVVLFLRAILLGTPGGAVYVAAGAASGLAACLAGFAIMARVGRRLPANVLLNVGGALLCLLAFVLAGKGVRSLQEAGLVSVSVFEGPRSDLLGVFPTLQTLGAQLAVIALVVIVAFLVPRRSPDQPAPSPQKTTS